MMMKMMIVMMVVVMMMAALPKYLQTPMDVDKHPQKQKHAL